MAVIGGELRHRVVPVAVAALIALAPAREVAASVLTRGRGEPVGTPAIDTNQETPGIQLNIARMSETEATQFLRANHLDPTHVACIEKHQLDGTVAIVVKLNSLNPLGVDAENAQVSSNSTPQGAEGPTEESKYNRHIWGYNTGALSKIVDTEGIPSKPIYNETKEVVDLFYAPTNPTIPEGSQGFAGRLNIPGQTQGGISPLIIETSENTEIHLVDYGMFGGMAIFFEDPTIPMDGGAWLFRLTASTELSNPRKMFVVSDHTMAGSLSYNYYPDGTSRRYFPNIQAGALYR